MKNFRKLAAVLTLVSFIFGTVSPAIAAGIAKVDDLTASATSGTGVKNASTIYFGNFWQGASVSDGKSAIAWKVLQTDASNAQTAAGTSAAGITLLTEKAMYAHYYNPNTYTNWKDSEIRATLNGDGTNPKKSAKNPTERNSDGTYGTFAGDAFNDKEFGYILTTANEIPEKTNDKLFLLSPEEVKNGGTMGFISDNDRIANATAFAKNNEAYGNTETYNGGKSSDPACWWLRSPGHDYVARDVDYGGGVFYDDVYRDNDAARAALNLDKQSVIFLSAAEATKSDGTNYDKNSKTTLTTTDGFALADYTGANGYKLTLKADKVTVDNGSGGTEEKDLVTPTIDYAKITGSFDVNDFAYFANITGSKTMNFAGSEQVAGPEELSVSYRGATTGTNMYVSALLYNENETEMLNYAKVASAASSGSGTNVAVDLSKVAAGEYKVKFFGEQENGNYQTDYASALSSAYDITVTGKTEVITTLKSGYADSGLTANLTDNAKLGFESAKYDTVVNVGTNGGEVYGGTTIAELNADTGDATVTGFVNATTATIAEGKKITTNGAFVSNNYVAIGQGAVVNSAATNSVAIGNGSVANEANTISVGSSTQTRSINNVTAVTPASGGTYAATTGQVYDAMFSSVTLGADNKTLTVAENGTTKDVDLSALKTTQGNTLESYFTSGVANCATADASGNVITTTYATKSELTTHTENSDIHVSTADRTKWNGYEATINGIDARVTANTDSISDIQTDLSTKAAVADVTALSATVAGHTTEIGNLQTAVAAKANADEVYTKTETYNKTQIDRMIGSGGKLGVAYTDDTFAEIKLAGTEGTKISSLKAGEISETSTEAVNGAQLYETNANITANKKAIEAINDTKTGILAQAKNYADEKDTATLQSAKEYTDGKTTEAKNYTDMPANGQVRTNKEAIESLRVNKADKATTLEGYGITDAYTKINVDDKVMNLNNRIDNIVVSGSEAIGAKKIDETNDRAASAQAKGSIAEAYNSGVSKNSTAGIAIGYGATVGYENGEITTDPTKDTTAENSIAIGVGSTVTGANSIAVGTGHTVSGNNSGAFGDPNKVTGNASYAFGNNNEIAGANNFVLGNEVKIGADVTNSVALGNKSEVKESNVVSVGSAAQQRRIVNVADGINPTDAANMRQLNAVRNELGSVSNEIKEVGAISATLAGHHYAEPSGEEGDKFVGAVAYGNYRGESAGAIGVAYKPSPNLMMSASTSVGNSQNAYNAGISLKFGKGETAKTKAELQKQVKYLNDKTLAQDAEIQSLKSDNEAIRKENAEIKEMLNKLLKK